MQTSKLAWFSDTQIVNLAIKITWAYHIEILNQIKIIDIFDIGKCFDISMYNYNMYKSDNEGFFQRE